VYFSFSAIQTVPVRFLHFQIPLGGAEWRSRCPGHAATILPDGNGATIHHMARDSFKNLSPLTPARLEEREWKVRDKESKKTHRKPRPASTSGRGKKSKAKR
jgi:hypothetical protein